jgi:hypothetical protein
VDAERVGALVAARVLVERSRIIVPPTGGHRALPSHLHSPLPYAIFHDILNVLQKTS